MRPHLAPEFSGSACEALFVMPPGQPQPNALEIAILEHLASEYPDVQILISNLHVLDRSFTGVGSFTDFVVRNQPPVSRRILSSRMVVSIPGLQHGLSVVAFREGDRLTLETYSFGGEQWDGRFEGFVIEPNHA